jgi:site-specific DNA-methyltransferase (adenine-specific)
MAVRIEDAGFEIRDQIMWIYGSGFPKSHNIALAIDKAEGATGHRGKAINIKGAGNRKDLQGKEAQNQNSEFYHKPYNEPISDNGKEWNGWGTALKPAHEPIVMARKPLIGTVADNVLEWGVGGINIDGCRVSTDDKLGREFKVGGQTLGAGQYGVNDGRKTKPTNNLEGTYHDATKGLGRFPANVIMDDEAGKILDEQSGTTKSSKRGAHNNKKTEHTNTYTPPNALYSDDNTYGDEGGASRFFYCPKASKSDRDEGVDYVGQIVKGRDEGQDAMSNPFKLRPAIGATYAGNQTVGKIGANPNKPTQPRANIHPTVKPTELMKYLIRLVTPKGGVVLDPFMGSGSTGKAAVREGMDFIGIERELEYYEIAKQRIENETNKRKFW